MAFDIQKFSTANLVSIEVEIPVPELSMFFSSPEDSPSWKVRGLTGHELSKVNEAVAANREISLLVEGLASGEAKVKIDAIKESLGITDRSTDDIVRRIAILKAGSVEPTISQELSVRLADAFPVTFFRLTNRILELTGEGKRLGE